jgi:hypothetical protein
MMRLYLHPTQEHASTIRKSKVLCSHLFISDDVCPGILMADNLGFWHEISVAPCMIEMMVSVKHVTYRLISYGTYLTGNVSETVRELVVDNYDAIVGDEHGNIAP